MSALLHREFMMMLDRIAHDGSRTEMERELATLAMSFYVVNPEDPAARLIVDDFCRRALS